MNELDQAREQLVTVTAELESRVSPHTFSPERLCFEPQLAFVLDRSPFVVACTTRRAGKTVGARVKLLRAALSSPGVVALYVAQTRGVAEELMWRGLKQLNEAHHLGGVTNDTKLAMELPNGSRIRLGGAKDKKEADKLRGPERIALAIVDEAQNFRESILQYLIEEVLEPGMLDVGGRLVVAGTPGALPVGYFHAAAHNQEFSRHSWSLRQNPHLGVEVEAFLAGIRRRRGIDETNATYRREYLGEWVKDLDALMLHYESERNHCEWQAGPVEGWTYVQVFDLGFVDSDALGVLGWPPHDRRVHLVREDVVAKQSISALGDKLQADYKLFKPMKLVGDLGGLGVKIADELRARWRLPVEAAEKTRKAEHIELTNDGLRSGNLLAPRDSVFAGDCQKLQWDMDAKVQGVFKESPGFHSDSCDMVLYGYRCCWAFLNEAPPTRSRAGTPEAFAEQEAEHMQARIEELRRAKEQPWWEATDDV